MQNHTRPASLHQALGCALAAKYVGHRCFVAHVAQISGGNAQANVVNSTDLVFVGSRALRFELAFRTITDFSGER
jgi:hypothetical protein